MVNKGGAGIGDAQVSLLMALIAYVPAGAYTLTVEAQGFPPLNPVAVTVGVGETVVLDPVVLSSSALYLPVVSNNAAKTSAASVEEKRWLFLPALVR